MIYALFESTFVTDEGFQNIAISIVLIVTLLIVSFITFNKWKNVLICWFIIIILLTIITFLSCYLGNHFYILINITFSKIFLRASLIICIGIPVGLRFLYNSLYTNHYPIFLENSLLNEKKSYEKAKEAIKLKRRDMLPSKYEVAFSVAYMDKQKNASKEEDIVAICTEIYYSQIEHIVNKQPSLCSLLKKQEKRENDSDRIEKTDSIPQSNDYINEAVKEYESMRPRPKMQKFCKEKCINYDLFKAYRNNSK